MSTIRQKDLFSKADSMYFVSTFFLQPKLKDDIIRLYSFVWQVYQFCNSSSLNTETFDLFERSYLLATANRQKGLSHWESGDEIIDDFILLSETYAFDSAWTRVILTETHNNLSKSTYFTLDEIIAHMQGTAEIIALYLCQLLHQSKEIHNSAKLLCRAIHYSDSIRNLQGDIALNRQYIPASEVDKYTLQMLNESTAKHAPQKFEQLICAQIAIAFAWQKQAITSIKSVPKNQRVIIKTISDMYMWINKRISKKPSVIFEKKVSPSKIFILFRLVINIIFG
jgi:phytoene/squalene synthetase